MPESRKYLTDYTMAKKMESIDLLVAQSRTYCSDPDASEVIEDFLLGEHFRQLTYAEKALSYNALNICADSNPWLLGVTNGQPEGTLFPSEYPTVTMEAHEDDALLLSGAIGAEVVEEYKDCYADTYDGELVADEVFSLERLTAIGAFVRRRESFQSIGAKLTYEDGPYEKSVGVGGDMHGDFVMIETSGVRGATIAPNGMKVPFAPVETVTLAGYHSIEIGIVEACLQHVTPGMTSQERKAYFDMIINADVDKEREGSHAFGDYATSLRNRFHVFESDDEVAVRQGNTLVDFLVQPGNFKLRLEVRSMPNGLRFLQTYERDDGTVRESAPIDVSDGSIPDFINVIRFSDMGRVAPYEIEETARQILLGDDENSRK